MAANQVAWFGIYVQDMSRARRFYESLLQVILPQLNAPLPEVRYGPSHPAWNAMAQVMHWLRWMAVLRADWGPWSISILKDALSMRSELWWLVNDFTNPKYPLVSFGFLMLAYDTEGNMFGLHSLK